MHWLHWNCCRAPKAHSRDQNLLDGVSIAGAASALAYDRDSRRLFVGLGSGSIHVRVFVCVYVYVCVYMNNLPHTVTGILVIRRH